MLRPEDPQRWIGLNIKRIAAEIINGCLNGDKYNSKDLCK